MGGISPVGRTADQAPSFAANSDDALLKRQPDFSLVLGGPHFQWSCIPGLPEAEFVIDPDDVRRRGRIGHAHVARHGEGAAGKDRASGCLAAARVATRETPPPLLNEIRERMVAYIFSRSP